MPAVLFLQRDQKKSFATLRISPAGSDDVAGMRSIGVAGTFPAEALSGADVVVSALGALRVRVVERTSLEITWD